MVSANGKEVFWSILSPDIAEDQTNLHRVPLTWVNYPIDPIISSFPKTEQLLLWTCSLYSSFACSSLSSVPGEEIHWQEWWMNERMDVSKQQNGGSTFPSSRQRQTLTERGTWRLLDTLGHLSHGIIIVTTLTCRRYLIVGSHAAGRPVLLIPATSTLRLIYNSTYLTNQ